METLERFRSTNIRDVSVKSLKTELPKHIVSSLNLQTKKCKEALLHQAPEKVVVYQLNVSKIVRGGNH